VEKLDLHRLKETICRSLCGEVDVIPRPNGGLLISTPFTFDDGDAFTMIASQLPGGGVRISDCGDTLMHLSYSMDVDAITGDGNRGELFRRVLSESDVNCDDGEIYVEAPYESIGSAMFRLGQAITRVYDISFLNRARVASTFYDDLTRELFKIVPESRIQRDYVVPDYKDADRYKIDYRIESKDPSVPVFLFGIPNPEKAKLATVILEHWLRNKIEFDSLLVFENQNKIARDDLARLSNIGGEMISSLDATEDMKRKLGRRISAGPLA
jgi:hypothetical protein